MATGKTAVKEKKIERNITSRYGGFSFQVRMMVDGHRINETFDTLAEARAFRDRKKSDLTTDPTAKLVLASRQAHRDAAKTTLATLLDRYEVEVSASKKGVRAEKHRLAKLRRSPLASLPITHLDRAALAQFIGTWRAEASGSENTLRKYVMLVSAVFETAIRRWGMKLINPARQIETPSNGPARDRRLEPGEHARLLASLKKCRSSYVPILFELAVETAARRGELLKLDWRDVNLSGRTAILRDTKNGESRRIPLSERAVELLDELSTSKPKGLVIPLKEYEARGAWDYALKRAREEYVKECATSGAKPDPDYLRDLRFHDLRHEATSRLFESGKFELMEVAEITGHKTLSMLKRYTHLRAEQLADKMRRPAQKLI